MNNPKIPQTKYPLHELVTNRWSARSFNSQPIAEDTLHGIFEAASWTASSMNEQPWMYIYAHRDEETFAQFVSCLLPGNEPWAKNAAVLILSVARTSFVSNGKPNRHAMYDTGAANATLMLQATSHGILGHQMGGFDPLKTREVFQLPDEVEPTVFIALGYPGLPEDLEEPFKTREQTPRSRKPLAEFVSKKLPDLSFSKS